MFRLPEPAPSTGPLGLPQTPAASRVAATTAPAAPRRPERWGGRLRVWAATLVGALCAAVLYLGTRRDFFLADDFIFLQQLRFGRGGFWRSFEYFASDWGMHSQFYRPLVRVLWAAEYGLFGERAGGWHLVSTLLHAASAGLVGWLAWRVGARRTTATLLGGLAFGLHPGHAEPVTWIADQSDLLVVVFCLASLTAYLQARQATAGPPPVPRTAVRAGRMNLAAAACAYGLALTCKESAVSFGLLPFAFEGFVQLRRGPSGWRDRRSWLAIARRQVPFWGLTAAYLALRWKLFGGMGGYGNKSQGQALHLQLNLRTGGDFFNWLFRPLPWPANPVGWVLTAAVGLALAARLFRRGTASRVPPPAAAVLPAAANGGATPVTARGEPPAATVRQTDLVDLLALGTIWTGLFVVPALAAPSPRVTYPATVGAAWVLAALLTPLAWRRSDPDPAAVGGGRFLFWKQGRWMPDPFAVGQLTLAMILGAATWRQARQERAEWHQASVITRTAFRELPRLYPNLPPRSRVYAVGLLGRPREGHPGSFAFGFPEGVQLAYGDPTLWGDSVGKFPARVPHPKRAVFVEFDGRHLRPAAPRVTVRGWVRRLLGGLRSGSGRVVADNLTPARDPRAR